MLTKMGKDEKVLVSIVIPHYNNSKYIKDCLLSIAKQTHQNYEVVIVDDSSRIDEREAAELLAKEFNCIFLANQRNRGVSEARNRGLEYSKGDVLTTIDPDDYYVDSLYLERVVVSFLAKSSQCVIGTKAVYVDEKAALITKKITKRILSGRVKEQFFARSCYIPTNIFYSPQMLNEVGGYNSKFRAYEDWDFKLRLANCFEFHIENVEVAYRIHNHGLSTLGRLQKLSKLFDVLRGNVKLLSFKERFTVLALLIKFVPEKLRAILGLRKY